MPLMNKSPLSKQHELVFMLQRAKGGGEKANVGEEDCACLKIVIHQRSSWHAELKLDLKKKKF